MIVCVIRSNPKKNSIEQETCWG